MKRIPIFLISTLFMVFIVGTPALAFSPGLDEAQQNTVVGGVVVDKNNEPLIGVTRKILPTAEHGEPSEVNESE